MLCPACKVDLLMTERQGVEIDYCPKCRGVWLDRGELDKILERSRQDAASERPAQDAASRGVRSEESDPRDPEKRRKKSFFENLFD